MSWRAWRLSATWQRTAVEAGVAAFGLTVPIALMAAAEPDFRLRSAVLSLGIIYVGLLGAAFGAVRLRRTAGPWRRQLGPEAAGLAALALAIWVGTTLGQPSAIVWPGVRDVLGAFGLLGQAPVFGGMAAAVAAVVYPFLRGAVVVWGAWRALRRRRIFWALAHAQLLAAVALAVIVAMILTATDLRFGAWVPGPIPVDPNRPVTILAALTMRILPTAIVLLILSVAASATLLPLSLLTSRLVMQRAARRLEGLAATAQALRRGDLAARVAVSGEDEVAQLQTSFNQMAADLERTVSDLQTERDRVAGLLDARRQLVASISHELRTPVATVRSYLDAALGQSEVPAPADLRSSLETMEQEIDRLQRLIDDLFALSRAEVGRLTLRLEPVDVGRVVRRAVETTAPIAWRQRRVQVVADVPSMPVTSLVDSQRFEQIVGNLLANAVRHTAPGGLVAAALAAEPAAIRLEVRDTGEGIPDEELDQVFERYHTGAPAGDPDRAGLGLALVRELTNAMGGSVDAVSTPGEGSCFVVRLQPA